ncbi:MAG: carboxymuconolactone decarboxylase family protein [Methanobacterium sp.]|jgi:AhpD family alkylhydroperoxidase|nr:carboxymuconolactone decarboxylase family protein [Methanobacterium sp.]
MEQKAKPNRFTEAIGEEVDSAFKKLASEILKDGALTLKEKSLIAVACAIAVRCDPCTRVHQKQALKLGASQEEILEAAAVAGLVRMGSGFNTAYALLEEDMTRTRVQYKKNPDEKKEEDKPAENRVPQREPDGYITNLLGKNSVDKIESLKNSRK